MKSNLKWLSGFCAALLLVLAITAGAQYLTQNWTGLRIGDVTDAGDGTLINRIELVSLAFAGDSSKTATVDAIDSGASYYVLTGWKTNSANSEAKVAISSTTLTATASAATTGTLTVMIVQTP